VPSPELGAAWALQDVCREKGTHEMLHWAVVFFLMAIVAAVFGFVGIIASAASLAKVLFVVFLVLAGISLLVGRRVVA
jgi:uncharacterized membrane protein YtjA (UPF0391 family)